MSHVVSIKAVLTDLAAVEATCKELGLTFKRNQKTYKWWGRSVGDYPLPTGFKAEDLGKCEHAIGIPGTQWEVGVVYRRNADGSVAMVKLPNGNLIPSYTLLFDFYGSQGQPILNALGGEQAKKFTQIYGINKATIEAKNRGHMVLRTMQPNGTIRLSITGRTL